ncbi:LysR family transcriptional regulator [Paraferrimonas sedimenticola]|uniref:LysR family transcriptional regulator n=1 Tax=Paraferrimonas sedimenticola TaxID=375674 RepID=A0AA37RUX5_9GAMM|nr:LysR family transcriptional regulator [Paraferrimonas sedimenticola]GLP96050.1 LysR family transcriptional regulator [Paraferrimonas sedimenticola]
MTLDQMRYFLAVATESSVSKAAMMLQRDRSVVSQAISSLEDELGLNLFERSGNSLKLTQAGNRLVLEAKYMDWQASRVLEIFGVSETDQALEVKIGISEIGPRDWLTALLSETELANYRVSIVCKSDDLLLELLEQGELSFVLVASDHYLDHGGDSLHCFREPLVTVCAPDSHLADSDKVDIETLVTTRQILSHSLLGNLNLKLSYIYGRDVWVVGSLNDVLSLVERDLGWAVVPYRAAAKALKSGALALFEVDFDALGSVIEWDVKFSNRQGDSRTTRIVHDWIHANVDRFNHIYAKELRHPFVLKQTNKK